MNGFVYIVERGSELDVYESLLDAEEACAIINTHRASFDRVRPIEAVVFQESTSDEGPGSTRSWLKELRSW